MSTSLIASVDVFLAFYFTSVAAFYTFRILFLGRQRPQVALINHGRPFERQWIAHTTFRVFRASIWGVCVVRLFLPEVDRWIGYVALDDVWRLSGAALLLVGFVVALVGHRTLGAQWRSGVDAQQSTELVTRGVYARSRNPMFIGVRLAMLGFALALPSWFAWLSLILGWWMIGLQIKVEERHLANMHGIAYRHYRERVARWWWPARLMAHSPR